MVWVFSAPFTAPRGMPGSLWRLGQWVADHGVDAPGIYRAARALLLRRPPRLDVGPGLPLQHSLFEDAAALRRPDESAVEAAFELHFTSAGQLQGRDPPRRV